MTYYINKIVDLSFEEAVEKLTELLKDEWFSLLTDIDVKDTLKRKLNIAFRKYKILWVCNAPFAYNALKIEDRVWLLLPCNIIIQEASDGIEVATIDPVTLLSKTENPDLIEIAKEVQERFIDILDRL